MKKWEYKTVNGNSILGEFTLTEYMNLLGNESWELIGVTYSDHQRGSTLYFKREKQ